MCCSRSASASASSSTAMVFRGAGGIAGELGHVVVDEHGAVCRRGSRGCLEAVVSVHALARGSASRTAIPLDEMLRRAVAGDIGAGRIVADAGALVGRSVGHLLVAISTRELVIVGGELMRAGEVLLRAPARHGRCGASPSRGRLPRERARVVPAALGEQAELIGTLLYAGERTRASERTRAGERARAAEALAPAAAAGLQRKGRPSATSARRRQDPARQEKAAWAGLCRPMRRRSSAIRN